jgi:tRNA pseudouridine55 synthase
MSAKHFWRMTTGKVLEGVFGNLRSSPSPKCQAQNYTAINKPKGISSAQVLRDLQHHFNPSATFAPWISVERSKREREAPNQRRRRREKDIKVKIGHGGTLDPLATGVLIAGVGNGTKQLGTFLECTKTYDTIVLFGASTDTQDRVGRILKRAPYQHITRQMVEKALGQFRGKFMQLPPLYSALKMNGKPLYEYAREGKEIPREIEKRAVEVTELELLEWMEGGSHDHKWPTEEAGKAEKDVAEKVWQQEKEADASKGDAAESNLAARKRKLEENQDELVSERPTSKRKTSTIEEEATMSGGLQLPDMEQSSEEVKKEIKQEELKDAGPPAARIRMTVTSGFYVRSLCHDLGEAVGSQAMMAELIRTRQGQFELGKNVLEYSDLEKGEEAWGKKIEAMLEAWEAGETLSFIPESEARANVNEEPEVEGDTKAEERKVKVEPNAAEGNMEIEETDYKQVSA